MRPVKGEARFKQQSGAGVQYGKTLINAYMGTGLQRDYVLNGMSTYIFFMSFVGDGSIVSTFFAVITTGDNASKTGKILFTSAPVSFARSSRIRF